MQRLKALSACVFAGRIYGSNRPEIVNKFVKLLDLNFLAGLGSCYCVIFKEQVHSLWKYETKNINGV